VPVTVAATEEDPTIFESRVRSDSLVVKVLKQPDQHTAFTIHDQLIWSRNRGGEQVLCIPSMKMGSQSLHDIIIDQAHTIVGYFWTTVHRGLHLVVVLVATNPSRGTEILQLVSSMLEGKGEWPTPAGSAAFSTNPHSTMAIDQYGLCRSISRDRQPQLLMGSHMPYDQYGAPYPGEHQDNIVATVMDLLEGSHPTSWIAREYCIRPRLEVHLQVVARASLVDGCETVDVDIIPSANGWHDQAS